MSKSTRKLTQVPIGEVSESTKLIANEGDKLIQVDANKLKVEIDKTLSVEGQAADAAAVGAKIETLTEEIDDEASARNAAIAQERNRAVTRENELEALFTAHTQEAVDKWFDEHPEATTTVQDNSLTINKMVVGTLGYVTPEMFGAVGDGTADDTTAIRAAIKVGLPVVFRGTYLVSGEMSGNATAIIGIDAKFVIDSDCKRLFVLPNACEVGGISLDARNHQCLMFVVLTADDIYVHDVEVRNIYGTNPANGVIMIAAYDNKHIVMERINVYDCYQTGNGVIADNGGNITAVLGSNYTDSCIIRDCEFREIHNIDSNGDIMFEDGGGVYVKTNNREAHTSVSNIRGYRYGKRLIKSQCVGTIYVDNITAYTDMDDNLSAIGVLNVAPETQIPRSVAIITNCNLTSAYVPSKLTQTQNLIASDADTIISNCLIRSRNQFGIELSTGSDCLIDSCKLYGYGVLPNVGTKMHISNSVFFGRRFAYCKTDSIIRISNCEITGTTQHNDVELDYPFLGRHCKEMVVKDCTFKDLANISVETGVCNISNVKFEATHLDCITLLSGASVVLDNLHIINASENTMARAIAIKSEAKATLKNVHVEGFSGVVIGNFGEVTAINTDINQIYTDSEGTLLVKPEYYDALPKVSGIPNGTRVLLSTDGRLYELIENKWTAVGATA